MWEPYKSTKVLSKVSPRAKSEYSITGDILSFNVCPRQYGFFCVRGYQPAHIAQMWYGMVIHQVLDKLHMQYDGLINEELKKMLPSDKDVERYFLQVENSLRARGLTPFSRDAREMALEVLKSFNNIEGPTVYPKIKDTECKLQKLQGNYILKGVVDVIACADEKVTPDNYDSVEIWDYKGSKRPVRGDEWGGKKLNAYENQMLVYAELYRLKTGKYPLRGVLYFMNELPIVGKKAMGDPIYRIDFTKPVWRNNIDQAIQSFSTTVAKIEKCCQSDRWDPPDHIPDKETCDGCDIRWSCKTMSREYRKAMRYP